MANNATQVVVHMAASHSLDDVNAEIAQDEATLGTLSALGNNGSETTLTYAMIGLPANAAVVAPQQGGNPVVPAGATVVAKGTIFIQGALTLVAASRK